MKVGEVNQLPRKTFLGSVEREIPIILMSLFGLLVFIASIGQKG